MGALELQSELDDTDVAAFHAGQEAAFDRLMARHERGVFRLIYRSVHDVADARELTVQVFTKAYFALGEMDRQGKFRAWLFRIARNLIIDRTKTRAYRQQHLTHSLDEPPEDSGGPNAMLASLIVDDNPSELAENRELVAILQRAIDQLPERNRLPFVLCALEGYSHEECAETLGLTSKAVEMRIYKARKKVKAVFEKSIEGKS